MGQNRWGNVPAAPLRDSLFVRLRGGMHLGERGTRHRATSTRAKGLSRQFHKLDRSRVLRTSAI